MMVPRSTSLGSWTKGVRTTRALAMEAVRYALGAWLLVTLVFLAFQVWTGSPEATLAPHNPQYQGYVQENRATFALDQPVWTRYAVWLQDVATGQLGLSYYFKQPVANLIVTYIPPTVEIFVASTLWAALLGGLLGWASSSRRFPLLGSVSRGAGLLLYALPVFWILLLTVLYATQAWQVYLGRPPDPIQNVPRVTGAPILDSLLAGNLGEAWLLFWGTAVLTLPVGAALSFPVAIRVRNGIVAARDSPRFAGLPPNRGLPAGEAARAGFAPLAGGLAAVLPFVASAVPFEEWIANRRGLGWLAIMSVNHLDIPSLQAALVFLTLLAVAGAFPLALIGAGLVRRPPSWLPPAPQLVPDAAAARRWVRGVATRLRRRPSVPAWLGLALVAVPVLLAAAAPWLSPYGPTQAVPDASCSPYSPGLRALQPPCPAYPMGTNYFGYDIFSQVLQGGDYLVVTTLTALAVSAGIAVALALLCGLVGRGADVPLRAGLGAIAVIPCLAVLLLFTLEGLLPGTTIALEVLFVPVLFRDARDLVAPVAPPTPLVAPAGRGPGVLSRLVTSVGAVGPGLAARLPRRLAEMGLLLEALSFLGFLPPTVVDWARITAEAVDSNAVGIGNWAWLAVPGLLLFVYAAGLMLLSDGLRFVLTPEPPKPAPAAMVVSPVPAPPVPAAANP